MKDSELYRFLIINEIFLIVSLLLVVCSAVFYIVHYIKVRKQFKALKALEKIDATFSEFAQNKKDY